ncbi:hypothetical protein N7492_001199 [Penicillium capsulatum]|uniref:Uncharacterized protein n=1 Tax=Penicillium capsulatum TaxID=69766 RepID=A0A9W9IR28_9EURO|nr:hypothetical protein N7492_001199 [Penicillium capsulatum]KAJ6129744.1 hypothetical protein N7512_002524 [Penicillium capsulatum]
MSLTSALGLIIFNSWELEKVKKAYYKDIIRSLELDPETF